MLCSRHRLKHRNSVQKNYDLVYLFHCLPKLPVFHLEFRILIVKGHCGAESKDGVVWEDVEECEYFKFAIPTELLV